MVSEPKFQGAIIRHATHDDIPLILSLIQELADYEHASEDVKATPALLASTLAFAPSASPDSVPEAITPQRPARCLLLYPFSPSSLSPEPSIYTDPSQCAGLALYYTTYSTWLARPGIYLEDLYIRPTFRRRGYAGALLAELARITKEINGGRLEWSVLKWNIDAIKFYEAVGARMMSEWVGMRVEGEGLDRLARRRGGGDIS